MGRPDRTLSGRFARTQTYRRQAAIAMQQRCKSDATAMQQRRPGADPTSRNRHPRTPAPPRPPKLCKSLLSPPSPPPQNSAPARGKHARRQLESATPPAERSGGSQSARRGGAGGGARARGSPDLGEELEGHAVAVPGPGLDEANLRRGHLRREMDSEFRLRSEHRRRHPADQAAGRGRACPAWDRLLFRACSDG
jgi:hypothetical protein